MCDAIPPSKTRAGESRSLHNWTSRFRHIDYARAGYLTLALWALAGTSDLAHALSGQHQDAPLAIAIAVAILLSALVSSIVGFAFSALAGCALAWLNMDPVRAVQTMVVCSIATQAYAVWTIRDSIRWTALWPMIAAGCITVPVGVWLLLHTHPAAYAGGLGLFLLLYGAVVLLRRQSRPVRGGVWQDAIAGALGGLAGGLAGFPGSFVTIWCSMQGGDKLQQRAVYQPFILAMQLVTLAWLGAVTVEARTLADLRFVPFALVGATVGLALFRRMTNRQFNAAVTVSLMVSGLGLLARAV